LPAKNAAVSQARFLRPGGFKGANRVLTESRYRPRVLEADFQPRAKEP